MTIQTFYEVIGEDYEDVFNRFMMESLVVKFVKKFIEDPTFDMLEQSLENHDVQEAIRASHTFKGICDNMGFVKLKNQSEKKTELLKAGAFQEVKKLLPAFKQEYQWIIENAQKLL